MPGSLLFAVHLADGVLAAPLVAAGFAVAALLAVAAAWRIREDEIPRVALLTAAFFVASSIHVKVGPTSVHLLLGGLVGIVLGRRAPLAVLVGVTLQALLIPHGGISTIGVNTCVQALPALLAALLFGLLSSWRDSAWLRSLLVGAAGLAWGACLLFGLAVLWTNSLSELVRWTSGAGLVVSLEHLESALALLKHPAALAGLGLFAVAAVLLERRLGSAPGFVRGMLVGMLAVLATTALAGLVLLLDGAQKWGTIVAAVFVAHLPLALLEGVICGTVVAFLGKVKPEMLGTVKLREAEVRPAAEVPRAAVPAVQTGPVRALLVLLALLALGGPLQAHGVNVSYKVDRASRTVTIRCAFETDAPDRPDVPKKAPVTVSCQDDSVLTTGELDDTGSFAFTYEKVEPLWVRIEIPGHPQLRKIDPSELEQPEPRSSRGRDLLLGLGLLLAGAAFVMSWRNGQRLRRLAESLERRA
jgi:cobalt/nickel transport system permease protein